MYNRQGKVDTVPAPKLEVVAGRFCILCMPQLVLLDIRSLEFRRVTAQQIVPYWTMALRSIGRNTGPDSLRAPDKHSLHEVVRTEYLSEIKVD